MPPQSPFRVDPFEYPPHEDDCELRNAECGLRDSETEHSETNPQSEIPNPQSSRPGTHGPVNLSTVPATELDWLWPGRIPLGKLTLLVGDPDAGKSLVALDVAARVTTGAPWPGDCPNFAESSEQNGTVPLAPALAPRNSQLAPSSVLLLSAEDDIAATIRPRLEAAGADLTRVVAIPPNWSAEDPKGFRSADTGFRVQDWRPAAERPAPPRPFDLRRDLHAIENLLMRMRPCRLIVIDPLSAYLGASVDNFNSEVRRLLAPLAALAERRRLAILAISHLRKQSAAALHRTVGSLAFTAAARAVWLIARDPSDPDRRLMLPVKNNLAATGGTLSFTVKTVDAHAAPVVAWSPEVVPLTADEALRPRKAPMGRPNFERDDAIEWLKSALADGVKPARRIQNHAEAHGLRYATVRRAFRELGGQAVKAGWGPLGAWYWRLPGIGPQEPTPNPDQLFDD